MVDRNKKAKNKAAFKKVSDEIAKQEHIDYQKQDMIDTGFQLCARNIELNQTDCVMKMKEEQIQQDNIQEEMNGMKKSKGLIIAEHNALKHEFNLKIAEYNKLATKLHEVYKVSHEDIQKLASGTFNYKFWKEDAELDKDKK